MPVFSILAMVTLYSFGYHPHRLQTTTDPAFLESAFAPFKPKINTRWDNTYFYVESDGIPSHPMMSGITNWQQQVPIPQCYIGANAWSIPLNPEKAATPVPVSPQHFLRGAIAIAANGIPIFNPYTNTGADALLDGQLDNYGGHCGRADDYHYHVAPLFLENQTTKVLPIAFALDGYAVYGSKEPDGSAMQTLDANHGHTDAHGVYHYHGTKAAPYMVGNMVGKVTEDATLQIIPQASAKPVRPSGTPLKGASITSCIPNNAGNGYTLSYTLSGIKDSIVYNWTPSGNFTFDYYVSGTKTTSNYNGSPICLITSSGHDINNSESNVLIAQNAESGALKIMLNHGLMENEIKDIQVYSLNGSLVLRHAGYTPSIDFDAFNPGIYFVKIHLPRKTITQKIFISR